MFQALSCILQKQMPADLHFLPFHLSCVSLLLQRPHVSRLSDFPFPDTQRCAVYHVYVENTAVFDDGTLFATEAETNTVVYTKTTKHADRQTDRQTQNTISGQRQPHHSKLNQLKPYFHRE